MVARLLHPAGKPGPSCGRLMFRLRSLMPLEDREQRAELAAQRDTTQIAEKAVLDASFRATAKARRAAPEISGTAQ